MQTKRTRSGPGSAAGPNGGPGNRGVERIARRRRSPRRRGRLGGHCPRRSTDWKRWPLDRRPVPGRVIESMSPTKTRLDRWWNRRCPGSAHRHARHTPVMLLGRSSMRRPTSGAGWWRSTSSDCSNCTHAALPHLLARPRANLDRWRRGQRELGGGRVARQGNGSIHATSSAWWHSRVAPPGVCCPTRPGHGRRARATTHGAG